MKNQYENLIFRLRLRAAKLRDKQSRAISRNKDNYFGISILKGKPIPGRDASEKKANNARTYKS